MTGSRRSLAVVLALAAGAAALVAVSPRTAQAAPPGTKDVTAVLFEWKLRLGRQGVHQHPGPRRIRLRPGLPAPGAHPGRPVVDLVPARQLQDRRTARRPHRLPEHGRHLSRARASRSSPTPSSTTWPPAPAPAPAARRTPSTPTPGIYSVADFDDCTRADQQLPGPLERPELRAGRASPTSTPARTYVRGRHRRLPRTTCSRSASTASASTPPSTCRPPTSPTSSPG